MNYNDPVWKSLDAGNTEWSLEALDDGTPAEPLPESWPPKDEYLTQAEMQEFLDNFAELLHRVVDICTILAKGPGEANQN